MNYELRIMNSQLRTGNKFLTMLYSIQYEMRSIREHLKKISDNSEQIEGFHIGWSIHNLVRSL